MISIKLFGAKSDIRILIVSVLVSALTVGMASSYASASTDDAVASTDREALVSLYQATDGGSWLENNNWLTDAPLDTWHGVTTNSSGRVTALELTQNGLTGTVPAELSTLINLNELNLAENELTGTIPVALGTLANLKELNLSENELTGTIPVELACLRI